MKVVLATWNAHKVEEVAAILADAGSAVPVVSLADCGDIEEAPETGETFAENALQKARFVYERVGGIVIADDSGLEVDALHGAPGVFSKRYTEEATAEANNQKLLAALGIRTDRSARFVCTLALVSAAGEDVWAGTCEGHIAEAPRGDGGFGYDPLFVPAGWGQRTLAEATSAEKNAISHRGNAFRQLAARLQRHISPVDQEENQCDSPAFAAHRCC